MNLKIIKANLSHLDTIFYLEESSFSHAWSKETLFSDFRFPYSTYYILMENNDIVAFYTYWNILGECNLNNIVVREDRRGQGYGNLLIKDLINRASLEKAERITLEVDVNNLSAINLYRKNDFKIIGDRENYYGVGRNALVMENRGLI